MFHAPFWGALVGALSSLSLITALRVAVIVAWGTLFASRSSSIWRVLRGRARFYDALWALLAGYGAMTLSYNARWFAAPDSEIVFAGLHVFSVLLAIATLLAIRAYEGAHNG